MNLVHRFVNFLRHLETKYRYEISLNARGVNQSAVIILSIEMFYHLKFHWRLIAESYLLISKKYFSVFALLSQKKGCHPLIFIPPWSWCSSFKKWRRKTKRQKLTVESFGKKSIFLLLNVWLWAGWLFVCFSWVVAKKFCLIDRILIFFQQSTRRN